MDVLVKNMEIPESCAKCPFSDVYNYPPDYDDEWRCEIGFFYMSYEDAQMRHARCPFVEIVRCRDCKYNYVTTRNHGKQDDPRCDFTDRRLSLDDFCSRGEKRTEDEV